MFNLSTQAATQEARQSARERSDSFAARVPVLFKLQAGVLLAAFTAAVVIGTVFVPKGMQTVSFAIPANPQMQTWDQEVDTFAHKISNGFRIRVDTAQEFSGWILEAAARQNLTPELLASLVLTESSFRKNARSHVGAVGPAQIRPDYWSNFCGTSNLSDDPAENIYCGAQILAYYESVCGGMSCALHAYNVGMNNKRDSHRAKAGHRYVAKVDRYYDRLRNTAL